MTCRWCYSGTTSAGGLKLLVYEALSYICRWCYSGTTSAGGVWRSSTRSSLKRSSRPCANR